MDYGFYAAYLGMRARQNALDATASNIANASTTGFKADRVLYRSVEALAAETQREGQTNSADPATPPATPNGPQAVAGEANPQAAAERPAGNVSGANEARATGVMTTGAVDYSAGAIRETNRSLDVALDGDAFLVVQTARGQRYTRSGALTLDSAGQLVTQRGEIVVGERGPVTVPPGEVSIGDDGTISVKGQTLDRLKLARFQDPRRALLKEGATLFAPTGAEQPAEARNTRVVQGALEVSNVNSMSEMVTMMQQNREFESLQRSITLMMNDVGRKIAGEVGRI